MAHGREWTLHEFVDWVLIVGTLASVLGTYWDIRYHIDVGRDSFWIAPHLLVYGGLLLLFLGMGAAPLPRQPALNPDEP